jgi:hypothetical protein
VLAAIVLQPVVSAGALHPLAAASYTVEPKAVAIAEMDKVRTMPRLEINSCRLACSRLSATFRILEMAFNFSSSIIVALSHYRHSQAINNWKRRSFGVIAYHFPTETRSELLKPAIVGPNKKQLAFR